MYIVTCVIVNRDEGTYIYSSHRRHAIHAARSRAVTKPLDWQDLIPEAGQPGKNPRGKRGEHRNGKSPSGGIRQEEERERVGGARGRIERKLYRLP